MVEHDKRRYFRLHFKRKVQLEFSSDFYDKCQVQNISLGGMFVKGNFSHKVDDQCSVTIVHKSKTTYLTFRAKAKIVRRTDEGIALQFISMSFESLVLLELILLYEPRDDSAGTEGKLPTDLPFTVSEEDSPVPDDNTSFFNQS